MNSDLNELITRDAISEVDTRTAGTIVAVRHDCSPVVIVEMDHHYQHMTTDLIGERLFTDWQDLRLCRSYRREIEVFLRLRFKNDLFVENVTQQ